MIVEFWVWLLSTAVAFGLIAVYGIATLTYRLGEEALEVLVLGVPFRIIPYAAIQAASRGGSLRHEHWVTFRLRNRVLLSLRGGRRRAVVITPAEPDAFLRDLQSRLHAAAFGKTD
jgi:hypothetical protein